jgi:hypothetical protein
MSKCETTDIKCYDDAHLELERALRECEAIRIGSCEDHAEENYMEGK